MLSLSSPSPTMPRRAPPRQANPSHVKTAEPILSMPIHAMPHRDSLAYPRRGQPGPTSSLCRSSNR